MANKHDSGVDETPPVTAAQPTKTGTPPPDVQITTSMSGALRHKV